VNLVNKISKWRCYFCTGDDSRVCKSEISLKIVDKMNTLKRYL
jgi:hypothetical protein